MTVVVFHRILKRDDPRWATALLPWTIDEQTFDLCLKFFKRHYSLVTLEDIRASRIGVRRLPPRSLLITIDDGFADSFDYALPLLHKHGASAVVFVTSDMIAGERWIWTDDLLRHYLNGRIGREELVQLHAMLFSNSVLGPDDPHLIWDIVRRGPELGEARVHEALSKLNIEFSCACNRRQMLNDSEIVNLVANGNSIGAHGKTHTAMPFASNLSDELRLPLVTLREMLESRGLTQVDALSFPHGAYSRDIIDQALATGYRLLFSGEAQLLMAKGGFLAEPLIPRIEVDGRRIAPSGRVQPERLATLLFTAPRRRTEINSRTPANTSGSPVEAAAALPSTSMSI